MMSTLRVTKRNGELEPVQFGKVTNRIKYLCLGESRDGSKFGPPLETVCYTTVAQKVISRIIDKISTSELDEDAARFCASKAKDSYQYPILGGRIIASNHQKSTISSFSKTIQLLYENRKPDGTFYPLIDRKLYKFISRNAQKLDAMIDHDRDFRFDYFGIMTLLGGPGKPGYILRRHDGALNVAETPQHLYMRVATALHIYDSRPLDVVLGSIKETYDMFSLGMYSHASPTMYNAGTHYQQLSSCFLLGIDDTMDYEDPSKDDGSIPACWLACSRISKRAGGIGIGMQPIRSKGTLIAGTGGASDGIVPLCRVLNMIACYVNQGGRRPGAFALYEEPWCGDIFAFLDLKKNVGIEEERARDLFYALWIPDLFMKRLIEAIEEKKRVMWSLMCPHQCPGLYTTYGEDFEKLYEDYERQGKYLRQVPIMDLWEAILTSQKETGGPYMLYKDHVNRKNPQMNLGVIRNSNLCAEIVQYSDDQEYAVCNLASVALPSCVEDDKDGKPYFNYRKLHHISKVAYRNLDAIIRINEYPMRQCKRSNLRHRPVGLGVQGWGDVLLMLDLPFEDTVNEELRSAKINPVARELNRKIAEVMYYACVEASAELAAEREGPMRKIRQMWLDGKIKFSDDGIDITVMPEAQEDIELVESMAPIMQELDRTEYLGTYSTFIGSPAQLGKLQYHMWDVVPENWDMGDGHMIDWGRLESLVKEHGLRGSMFRANMPTASTSQILGNVESTEPYKYAIYTRRVTAGEFVVVNKHLHIELRELGLWTPEVQQLIIKNRGSIQDIASIPLKVRDKYRTAFEVSKKTIQLMAAEQGPFICQTNSLNYFISQPNSKLLTNIHVGAWKLGLKTGMYYLRRHPNQDPVQFTVDGGLVVNESTKSGDKGCESCSA